MLGAGLHLWRLAVLPRLRRTRCCRPFQAYGYYASGSDDQWTLRENKAALQRYRLLPRMLVDVSQVDTSTTLLGEPPPWLAR